MPRLAPVSTRMRVLPGRGAFMPGAYSALAPESFTTLAHLTISTFTSRVDRRHSGRLALRASALTVQCAQLACAGAPNGIVGMRAWLVACRLGADLAADVARAPGVSSTTVCWLSPSLIFAASARARTSVGPPADHKK